MLPATGYTQYETYHRIVGISRTIPAIVCFSCRIGLLNFKMNSNEKRAWIMLITVFNALAFPTYFYYIYIRIPDFFNGLWFNIVTGLLLFCSGIHYVFMLSWFSVVCTEGEIRAKGFFTQILLICVWGLCMNIIHGQWILLLVCLGMMLFWIGIYETCFWPDYLGIPDHPQEEPMRPPSYSNV